MTSPVPLHPSLSSRYVRTDDPMLDSYETRIGEERVSWDFHELGWWSRLFEYSWLAEIAQQWFGTALASKTALDAGCGKKHTGCFILADLGFAKVIAQDLLPAHPLLSRATPPNLEYLELDFCDAAPSADFVCCISVIEHIDPERQGPALTNLCRALAPGGLLALTLDMPGFEYETDLDLYKRIILAEGLTFIEVQVEPKARLTSRNGPIDHPGWPKVGRPELTCYRLAAWRAENSR